MYERFLDKQVALITGGSNGIGAACAKELARRGADVIINYHKDKSAAIDVAEFCEQCGVSAAIYAADVSNSDDVQKMFNMVMEKFKRLDILVANAGIQQDSAFLEMSPEQWQKVLDVNLNGQFFCAQQAARIFVKQGVDDSISNSAGKIVHVSSVHDKIPWPGHVNYAVSKAGISMLMKTVAMELGPKSIRINAVSPGAIKTDINREVWEDEKRAEELKKLIPIDRIGSAEEIARSVAWVASDYSSYMTGETLYIDGGMMLYPSFASNG